MYIYIYNAPIFLHGVIITHFEQPECVMQVGMLLAGVEEVATLRLVAVDCSSREWLRSYSDPGHITTNQ